MTDNYGNDRPGYRPWARGDLRDPRAVRRFGMPRQGYFHHYGSPDIGGYAGDLIYELVPIENLPERQVHARRTRLLPRRPFHGDYNLEPGIGGSRPLTYGPLTNRYEAIGFQQEPAYTGDDYKRGYERGYFEDFDYDREGRMWWNRASDEIASWFGDDEAQRRRELDAYFDGNRGRGPRSYIRSDERISEDVNDFLTEDFYVDASDIDVKVENGRVTLDGSIPNRSEKRRAEDLTLCVTGVKEVEERLRVDHQFYRSADSDREQMKSRATSG